MECDPELWIHTHFVTDCVRLSHTQGRDIEAALLPVLRQQHIVYGIHSGCIRHNRKHLRRKTPLIWVWATRDARLR